jgi:UDP-glucose/GDP-mannose dehydrogenase family, UDP binding domain
VEGADAVVIVTEWEQFRALDLGRISDLMTCPVIVDLRNVYRPEDMKKHVLPIPASAAHLAINPSMSIACVAGKHSRAALSKAEAWIGTA